MCFAAFLALRFQPAYTAATMKTEVGLLLCGMLAFTAAGAGAQTEGYVTRAASGSDFDVNGYRVVCTGVKRGAIETTQGARVSAVGCPSAPPFVGEAVVLFGRWNKASRSVDATHIDLQDLQFHASSGSAVIDAAPDHGALGAQAPGLTVRADGLQIRITANTKIDWIPPLQSLADVKAGDWIKYKGRLDTTGTLVAESAEIGPNTIASGEEKLRAGKEYDASAIPADARQNYLKYAFVGSFTGQPWDPKKFPPFQDAAMQERLDTIGNSLVPAYQRALPDSDPAKINFRFQLIDTKLMRDALTLPNGIILVPHQVVERMQNDSQLAAVLADAIARALERQEYRTARKIKAGNAASLAVMFVPYAGPVISSEGESGVMRIIIHEQQQSGRVSLVLLHDAQYDIDQAPMAWWLLAPRKPKPFSEIGMPDRAAYLYGVLGETWHNPAAGSPQAH